MKIVLAAVAVALAVTAPAATALTPAPGTPATRVAALGHLFGDGAGTVASKMLQGATLTAPAAASNDDDAQPAPAAGTPRTAPKPAPVAPGAVYAPAGVGAPVMVGDVTARAQLGAAQASTGAVVRPAPSIPIQAPPSPAAPGPVTGPTTPSPVLSPVVGGIICPAAGPHSIKDSWGSPRGGGRTHQGTDMPAAIGIPVVAMADAVIVHIDPAGAQSLLGGITVSYTTSAGQTWYMAHLSRVAPGLAVGDYVHQGQVVGYVGSTGNSTGPHLHVGLNIGSGPRVNPYPSLLPVCG